VKKFSPKTARTLKDVCSLRTDNKSVGDSWIILDSGAQVVTIVNQKDGEAPTGEVVLTKEQFNRIIRWYQTPTRNPKP
jgi:hypothetical protein